MSAPTGAAVVTLLVVGCTAAVAGFVCLGVLMVRVKDSQRRSAEQRQRLGGLPGAEVKDLRRRIARGSSIGLDEQRAASAVALQMVFERRQIVASTGSACFAVAVGSEAVLVGDALTRWVAVLMGIALVLLAVGTVKTARDARAGERFLAEQGSPTGR